MSEDLRTNPYVAAGDVAVSQLRRRVMSTARWLALPFFTLGGAIVAAVATFVVAIAVMSAGDVTVVIAGGFSFTALIIGGIAGWSATNAQHLGNIIDNQRWSRKH